jgi:hypothetical protein
LGKEDIPKLNAKNLIFPVVLQNRPERIKICEEMKNKIK